MKKYNSKIKINLANKINSLLYNTVKAVDIIKEKNY